MDKTPPRELGTFSECQEGDAGEFYSALNSFMEERFSSLFSSGGMRQLGRFPADLGGKAGTYLYDFTLEFPMMHKIAWHCSDIPVFFHNTDKVEICRRSDPAPGILPWPNDRKVRISQFQQILSRRDTRELLMLASCLHKRKTEKGLPASELEMLHKTEGMIEQEFSFALNIRKEEIGQYIRDRL